MPYENTAELVTEIGKVDSMVVRFIKSEQAVPDEKNQLLWHSAAVEVVAQHTIEEIATNIQTKLVSGIIVPQAALREQTTMLEIALRSMFYAGFQLATDGEKLKPCDCSRFEPGTESDCQIGDYL